MYIDKRMLNWAITRAGYDEQSFMRKYPKFDKIIEGDKQPTLKQLEDFSKKVYVPFGYLFLSDPPHEELPIPFFRSEHKHRDAPIGINVYDTILLLQQRQNWLKDYLIENDFQKLDFVGRNRTNKNISAIVADIRGTLNLGENWAADFKTWEEALNHLAAVIEGIGIIVVFNGIVGSNTHRPIEVNECRGFVLTDEIAPFMFINNADSKSAQMLTIVHELAHIWIGNSAGFDFRRMLPANDPDEVLCDRIAAEFLVPTATFLQLWEQQSNIKYLSKYFKVSEIVIARKALDTEKWGRDDFFRFYNDYESREFVKRENTSAGGDFYATTKKRLSITFAAHIKQAVASGQLLYRDAYRLTNMKGDTFDKFIRRAL